MRIHSKTMLGEKLFFWRLHLHTTKLHVKRFSSSSTTLDMYNIESLNQSYRSDYIHQEQEIGERERKKNSMRFIQKKRMMSENFFIIVRILLFFCCSIKHKFSHDVCVCAISQSSLNAVLLEITRTHQHKVSAIRARI